MKYTIEGKEYSVGIEHIITAGLAILTIVCLGYAFTGNLHLMG